MAAEQAAAQQAAEQAAQQAAAQQAADEAAAQQAAQQAAAQAAADQAAAQQAAAASSGSCDIKGNINDKGERIYHVKGKSPSYDATKIDESKGERWFCSEAEAQAAGWRAPKNSN